RAQAPPLRERRRGPREARDLTLSGLADGVAPAGQALTAGSGAGSAGAWPSAIGSVCGARPHAATAAAALPTAPARPAQARDVVNASVASATRREPPAPSDAACSSAPARDSRARPLACAG